MEVSRPKRRPRASPSPYTWLHPGSSSWRLLVFWPGDDPFVCQWQRPVPTPTASLWWELEQVERVGSGLWRTVAEAFFGRLAVGYGGRPLLSRLGDRVHDGRRPCGVKVQPDFVVRTILARPRRGIPSHLAKRTGPSSFTQMGCICRKSIDERS